jgi:cell fate (sporulation/competence/biofilm development) regulator YlbF (YheA/YmcA/DUF963 family)
MDILTDNSIVEKAKSFAKLLASSQEFQKFYSAEEKLKQNQEAQSLLEQFKRKQQEFQEARMSGRGARGDAAAEIQSLQDKLQANPTIMAWARAQQEAISMIQEANQMISSAAGFDFGRNSSSRGPC